MGVAGLWDILRDTGHARSLTHLSVVDGFQANAGGKRAYRLGVDTSIWFVHSASSIEGENPELRMIFFRLIKFLKMPILPLFVFDGPKRPATKRGKRVGGKDHWMIQGVQEMMTAFGFEWRRAPGEAEAELAYLNRMGIIDGILSDDVDTFIFGAQTVIRNWSNTLSGNRSKPVLNASGKDDKQHVMVYTSTRLPLDRAGLILIALLRGGDYAPEGVPGCGVTTAYGLAKAGFGSALLDAFTSLPTHEFSDVFLPRWRAELIDELRTDKSGCIGKKLKALASKVPEDFPDLAVLRAYATPITSETERLPLKSAAEHWPTWRTKTSKGGSSGGGPDLTLIARFCEMHFEWGYEQRLIERMRLWMWPAIILQVIRRRVLLTASGDSGSRSRGDGADADASSELPSEMFKKIHSSRTHASTDGLLEYRIEFSPEAMVRIVRSGLRGLRQPPEKGVALGDDAEIDMGAGDSDEEDDDDHDRLEQAGKSSKSKKSSADPTTVLRDWFPACMVEMALPELVEAFEATERKKAERKAKKGQGRAATRKVQCEDDDTPAPSQNIGTSRSPRKKITRTKSRSITPAAAAAATTSSDAETVLDLAISSSPAPLPQSLPQPRMVALYEDDDDDDEDKDKAMPSLPPSPVKPLAKARARKAAAVKATSTEALFVEGDTQDKGDTARMSRTNAAKDSIHDSSSSLPSLASAPAGSSRVLALLDKINKPEDLTPSQSTRIFTSRGRSSTMNTKTSATTTISYDAKPMVAAPSGPLSSSSHTGGVKSFFAATKSSRATFGTSASKTKNTASNSRPTRRAPSPIRAAASSDHEDGFMVPSEKWIVNHHEEESEYNLPDPNHRGFAPTKPSSKVLSALAELDGKNSDNDHHGQRNGTTTPLPGVQTRRMAYPFPLNFDDGNSTLTAEEELARDNGHADPMPHHVELDKERQLSTISSSPRRRTETGVKPQYESGSNRTDVHKTRTRSASPPSPSLTQNRGRGYHDGEPANRNMQDISIVDISSDSDDDEQHPLPPPSQTQTSTSNSAATVEAAIAQPPLLLARSRRSKTAPISTAAAPTALTTSGANSKDKATTTKTKRRTFRTAASTSALVFSNERERQEQHTAVPVDVSMEIIDLT